MKFSPEAGDVGVIGVVDLLSRWPLGSAAFFFAAVTANGYASVGQNILDPQMRFCCSAVPEGINSGDTVSVDIAEENGVLIATNMQAL